MFGSPESHDPKGRDRTLLLASHRMCRGGGDCCFLPGVEGDKGKWSGSILLMEPVAGQ